MSESTEQLLRRLLPRYLWLRDAEDGGGVLAAIVAGLAAGYEQLRDEVDLLYDQFFIATCDPQFIPLLGDEIGVEGLAPVTGPGIGDRALVGRTIALRRRKGMLATAARGVTAASGWPAYIREGRAAVSATASVDDPGVRPAGFVTVSGRQPASATALPWSTAGRSALVSGRPIFAGEPSPGSGIGGFPAPMTVAVYVWRLLSFPVTERTAAPARDAPRAAAGRAFRFDPLGRDTQLFSVPVPPRDRELPPSPSELPLALTRDLLALALSSGQPSPVQIAGAPALAAGDLSGWHHPPGPRHADAVVDPQLGRILLAHEHAGPLAVSYAYGFPGELGGGPYGTADDYVALPPGATTVEVAAGGAVATIQAALAQAGSSGTASIVVQDSATYHAPQHGWHIAVPEGATLRISSAPEAAPLLAGEIHAQIGRQGRLELSGIALGGRLRVAGTGELAVEQCTLAPAAGTESLHAAAGVAVALSYSIAGGLAAGNATLESCIVDGDVACSETVALEHCTLLGSASAPTLQAGDCLITGRLSGTRGLVRTTYAGDGFGSLLTAACTGPWDGAARFVSTRFGDPGYCQLSLSCPSSISAGGSLGSELGAFNWLGQPERFARVPLILQELLPAGIGACVDYVT